MFDKENKQPSRQGVLYELSLGKDNGPYLSKDIMYSNPKSIALLAGSQIVKSFSSFNASMNMSESKQKQYNQNMSYVQSVNSTVSLLEQEISSNVTKQSKLRIDEMRLRHEFQIFNESISTVNSRLLQDHMPLLRGLYKAVKQQASMQKQQMFKMQKQLREISQAKTHLIQGIFKCEEKIINIERIFNSYKKTQSYQ